MAKRCPACGRVHGDEVLLCDCGHQMGDLAAPSASDIGLSSAGRLTLWVALIVLWIAAAVVMAKGLYSALELWTTGYRWNAMKQLGSSAGLAVVAAAISIAMRALLHLLPEMENIQYAVRRIEHQRKK